MEHFHGIKFETILHIDIYDDVQRVSYRASMRHPIDSIGENSKNSLGHVN